MNHEPAPQLESVEDWPMYVPEMCRIAELPMSIDAISTEEPSLDIVAWCFVEAFCKTPGTLVSPKFA
jgi:hypothetical protein